LPAIKYLTDSKQIPSANAGGQSACGEFLYGIVLEIRSAVGRMWLQPGRGNYPKSENLPDRSDKARD
jgi:hypothetical protein